MDFGIKSDRDFDRPEKLQFAAPSRKGQNEENLPGINFGSHANPITLSLSKQPRIGHFPVPRNHFSRRHATRLGFHSLFRSLPRYVSHVDEAIEDRDRQ